MARTNIKVSRETKRALDDAKREGETWDECLRRLVQLDQATRVSVERGEGS